MLNHFYLDHLANDVTLVMTFLMKGRRIFFKGISKESLLIKHFNVITETRNKHKQKSNDSEEMWRQCTIESQKNNVKNNMRGNAWPRETR